MGVFRQFPYSNFHDMNMDEIIKIVKDMLSDWAQYYTEWDNWKDQVTQEWSEMQSFINNYFNNLNVQTEINNKITDMVHSGEFSQIVDPYVPPAVADWLAEHITTPETVVIDDSLTIEGAAADAKATGDAITNIKENLSGFTKTFNVTLTGTRNFSYPILKNAVYIYTNNTSASISVVLYHTNDDYTIVKASLASGKSVRFIADDNYAKIGGYFNATGSVTLKSPGEFDIVNEIYPITEIIHGSHEEFAVSAIGTKLYEYPIVKDNLYTVRNNTLDSIILAVYHSSDDYTIITNTLPSGSIIEFIADDNYKYIGGYFNVTGGNIEVENKKLYDNVVNEGTKPKYNYVESKSVSQTGSISALSIIGNKLFVFPYVSDNSASTGIIYNINELGKITKTDDTFSSNIGHQPSADYCKYTKCFICSRYPIGETTQFAIYVMPNVDENTSIFDITDNDTIIYDMSNISGIGDTGLCAIWGEDNNGEWDIIYMFSEDSDANNRYLSRVQLGKGSRDLGNGIIIPGKTVKEFNGTFKIQKTYTLPKVHNGISEDVNDACYHNGSIYQAIVEPLSGRSFLKINFINYNSEIEIERILIDNYLANGNDTSIETEGIAIKNGKIYIGSYGDGIICFTI